MSLKEMSKPYINKTPFFKKYIHVSHIRMHTHAFLPPNFYLLIDLFLFSILNLFTHEKNNS